MKNDKYLLRRNKMCLFTWVLYAVGIMSVSQYSNATEKIEYNYDVTIAEEVVNPLDTKSDAKGIQSMLDKAIGSQTMVTIYFPAGKYYIDKTLKVYSNTHIILDEDATVYRMDSLVNNMLLHNVDQNGKMDVIGGYDMSQNIILEGGSWDGGNTKLATSGTNVIRFDHAQNITIKNCNIRNTYDCHIVELVGVKNGVVSGCILEGFRYKKGKENNYVYAREAIQLESAWTSNEKNLSDMKSAWAKGSIIDGTSCQQITIDNNKFIDLPCGVGQHRYTKSGKYRNQDITISNNELICSNSLKYCKTAITACGTNNLKIYNNTIDGPYRFAVHVLESDDVVISQNTICNIKNNGIMIDKGSVIAINDNNISNTKKHGISIGGGTIKEISGNTISGVKQNGICVDDGKITIITNNTIKKPGKHGMSIVGGTIGTGKKKNLGILKNKIMNCKQNGITVSLKAVVSAINGNTINNVKNNAISITGKAKVYWIVKNTIKKCKNYGIWNGTSTKTKISGNKGKIAIFKE